MSNCGIIFLLFTHLFLLHLFVMSNVVPQCKNPIGKEGNNEL